MSELGDGDGRSKAAAVEIVSDDESGEDAMLHSGWRNDPVDLDQNEFNAGTTTEQLQQRVSERVPW